MATGRACTGCLRRGRLPEAWEACVGALYAQGVTAETTQLVVSDGAKGLARALAHHRSGVPH